MLLGTKWERRASTEEALENKLLRSGCFSFATCILNLMRTDEVPWPLGEHLFLNFSEDPNFTVELSIPFLSPISVDLSGELKTQTFAEM